MSVEIEYELAEFQQLIERSLSLWPQATGATATVLNVSENIMYQIESNDGFRAVLRLHLQNNHSKNKIQSELAWMNALHSDGVMHTPQVIRGGNGEQIQSVQCIGMGSLETTVKEASEALQNNENEDIRHLVMYEFIDGREAGETDDASSLFTTLGEKAARMHNHTELWQMPVDFERGTWDACTLLGKQPLWGHWQEGPGLQAQFIPLLQALSDTIQSRLLKLGRERSNFGLIHADMRYANLIVTDEEIRLIDFDDCGFGWHLYDFATAVSFIEDHPQMQEYKRAWFNGYRTRRALPADHENEIDTFIMLRRLALLAWMGTHPEVGIVKALRGQYAAGTVLLAESYLATHAV